MWNPVMTSDFSIQYQFSSVDLRYADDTTFMAETEELKSLLIKVKKESEEVDIKLNT